MVIIGGSATTVILLVVVFATLHVRYRRLDPRLRSGLIYDTILQVSAMAIMIVAVKSGADLIKKSMEEKVEEPKAAMVRIAEESPQALLALD